MVRRDRRGYRKEEVRLLQPQTTARKMRRAIEKYKFTDRKLVQKVGCDNVGKYQNLYLKWQLLQYLSVLI